MRMASSHTAELQRAVALLGCGLDLRKPFGADSQLDTRHNAAVEVGVSTSRSDDGGILVPSMPLFEEPTALSLQLNSDSQAPYTVRPCCEALKRAASRAHVATLRLLTESMLSEPEPEQV